MSENLRDLLLTIGKKTYSIKTPLDDEVLERVQDLIDEACGVPVRGVNQEDLLILTCLKLAYSLDSATMKLNSLLSRVGMAQALQSGAQLNIDNNLNNNLLNTDEGESNNERD
ncbi:MAG: hypothetical protein IJR21_07345 [Synergistaceae bacterium]|nr:hypothetical protein [Synergistaceae bacterium]MBQ9582169.1 hypothetical protein [Synergistaceae bacterium]